MKSPADRLIAVHGEPSYQLKSSRVEAFLTRRGGHLGPVRFKLGARTISPYSISPWEPADCQKGTPPILQVLRGDFFCLPFGDAPATPVHGESANNTWSVKNSSPYSLTASLKRKDGSRIQKMITIDENSPAVYQEHVVSGLTGDFNFGHHTILQFPESGGPFHVNVSPFHFGQVKPEPFTNPANGEYSALKTGAKFRSLKKVPLATGGKTSLHEYPARAGFEDLVMISSKPVDFAWTAVTFDRYVWLQLKDPRVLPSTLFWLSNGGRHYPPWNGKHRNRLGLEEVCSHFSDGLSVSREQRLKKQKVPTTQRFQKNKTTTIRLVHVVNPVERDFGMVVEVNRTRPGTITVTSDQGKTVAVPVRWEHLYSKTKTR